MASPRGAASKRPELKGWPRPLISLPLVQPAPKPWKSKVVGPSDSVLHLGLVAPLGFEASNRTLENFTRLVSERRSRLTIVGPGPRSGSLICAVLPRLPQSGVRASGSSVTTLVAYIDTPITGSY